MLRQFLRSLRQWPPLLASVMLAMAFGGCARWSTTKEKAPRHVAVLRPKAPPIWAVQLNWFPNGGGGLQVQYDGDGAAYQTPPSTPGVLAGDAVNVWLHYTWKLTAVAFAGRQNFGADLRLSSQRGFAVHQLVLSLRPPSKSAAESGHHGGHRASIIFDTSSPLSPHSNTNRGLQQVGAGGNRKDSIYTCSQVAGRSAELFQRSVSYIYLRLDRKSKLFLAHPHTVYATITYAVTIRPTAWPLKTFLHLAAQGVHYAELNMSWAAVEPASNHFDFRLLDQTLSNAAKADVRIIPIFWYSAWPGSPAPWITRMDVGSSGAESSVPVWWSHFNRRAYFKYITTAIGHIKNNPGFGGAFLNFGWLDYMWGPPPGGKGVNGYARQDITEFHRWLPGHYLSLAAFNRRFKSDFALWKDVPAQGPGKPLFSAYQHFRNWSVMETYGRLASLVRRETSAPLYYYWGGGYNGAGVGFNIPDSFFQMARRYHVSVCEDCADRTGLMLLFGSLARAYKVPLLEEWTPHGGLRAEIPQFLGHYGFEMPFNAGMDFFMYGGGREFKVGYPPYVRWIPVLRQIHGVYPRQPVAVYLSFRPVFKKPTSLAGTATRLADIWRKLHLAFTVVTDREIKAGVAKLDQFRAVYPLNRQDSPVLRAYAAHGGRVVQHAAELCHYAPRYLTLSPASDNLEAVPTFDRLARSVWLTLSAWQFSKGYNGTVTFHLKGLGLPPGQYHVVNMANGAVIASVNGNGLDVPLHIKPGHLMVWRISPGPPPARH